MDGELTSSTPMATRLRSPPESPRTSSLPVHVCCTSHKPRLRSMLSTSAARSSAVTDDGWRKRAENSSDSRAVLVA